jgi:signal transduction histidine kinase
LLIYWALRACVAHRWTSDRCTLVARDLDDLLRFDEAIDQALPEPIEHFSTRLARLNELFVGVLAHDLRTPLQAVGLGLGLFIDKQIAIAHGGDVAAMSDIHHTEFRVRLPRVAVSNATHPSVHGDVCPVDARSSSEG